MQRKKSPLACRLGLAVLLLTSGSNTLAQDRDRDGLDDATELALGLDPDHPDSDCDGLDDGREVGSGASPQNTDGDSLIDALESAERDSNLDGQVDELDNDADSVWRIGCDRFDFLLFQPAELVVRGLTT